MNKKSSSSLDATEDFEEEVGNSDAVAVSVLSLQVWHVRGANFLRLIFYYWPAAITFWFKILHAFVVISQISSLKDF